MTKSKTSRNANTQRALVEETHRKSRSIERRSSLQRHERDCNVCHHPQSAEIEREWIAWGDTTEIAKRHHVTRDSIYRHAHARALFAKRRRNIHAALEQIIEKVARVKVTAQTVVAAVTAYAKINAQGQWVERVERVDMREIFDRMTRDELDSYARSGKLPTWAPELLSATRFDSNGEDSDG